MPTEHMPPRRPRKPALKPVREPHVAYEGRGKIAVHGHQTPVRGVIHSTECGDLPGTVELAGIDGFWRRQGLGYGAQLGIDKDGNTAVWANPDEICWAVENRNTGTYSIELVAFARFTPKAWFLRRKQLDELAKWIAWLNKEYRVPIVFDVEHGWSRHLDQSRAFGGTHTDPGRCFPLGYVLRKARICRKDGWA